MKSGEVQGFKHTDKADKVKVDKTFDQIDPEDYDAVLLPVASSTPTHCALSPKPSSL